MSSETKRPYSEIFPIAQTLLEQLRPHCDRIEIAGSLRRQRPLIGDIEYVLIPKYTKATNLFGEEVEQKYSNIDQWLARKQIDLTENGPKKKAFWWQGVKVELWIVTPATWGCLFLICTGSAVFSRDLMTVCQRWGYKFEKGRLFGPMSNEPLETPEEGDVFKALGVEWIPPQERNEGQYNQFMMRNQ